MGWLAQTVIVKGFLRQSIEEKEVQEKLIRELGEDSIMRDRRTDRRPVDRQLPLLSGRKSRSAARHLPRGRGGISAEKPDRHARMCARRLG